MMRRILFFITGFVFIVGLSAQAPSIDDYKKSITHLTNDSAAKVYVKIAQLSLGFNVDSARKYALLALKIAPKNSVAFGDASIQIGNTYHISGNMDSASANFNKALLYFRSINNLKGIAKCYQSFALVKRSLGDIYGSINDSKEALNYFVKINFLLGEVNTISNISNAYLSLKKYDSATTYARAAFHKSKQLNDSSKYMMYMAEYGGKAIHMLWYDTAAKYIKTALPYLQKNKMYPTLIPIYCNMAAISVDVNKNTNEAKQYLFKGINLSNDLGLKDNLRSLYSSLTEIYVMEKSDSARYYHRKAINIIDSLYVQRGLESTKELQTKYETEKKDLQIQQTNAELNFQEEKNKQKTIIIWLGTAAFVGTLFFLILAFINYRKAKKANLIIQNQNQVLELQKKEVEDQKHIIEEKQGEIISSINYAQRIQSAILTGEEVWNKISKEHFIIFQPRDIVSGDFYWAHVLSNGRAVFALADCTGHGVPGGFMSMLGNSFLNELVVENKLFKADEILNRLREKVIAALFQKGQTQQKDGMDMALCVWNKMDNTLEFAGANNVLYLVRDKQITEYKGDKMPIGTYLEENKKFTSQKITLQANDTIYLSTDGFSDQFGGEKGKKFKSKQLEELLAEVSTATVEEQKQVLSTSFARWKRQFEQTDDVSLIGIKVV
ncbi:MAG: SpoIIE family protein phosphatase [Bacteroidetes bacterium]|nr:SpoIIE family protein phosphatase [Bacteroidota bacterium]